MSAFICSPGVFAMANVRLRRQVVLRVGLAIVCAALLVLRADARVGVITVNRTDDPVGLSPDVAIGKCDADSDTPGDQCTLREAVSAAARNYAQDQTVSTIHFNIGGGTPTITLTAHPPRNAALWITTPVVIDGNTGGATRIRLTLAAGQPADPFGINGVWLIDPLANGVGSSGSIIRSLVLNGFTANGIQVDTNNNTIQNCYLGINAAGTAASANATGVTILGHHNTVTGNVISGNTIVGVFISAGNATANSVVGNTIGLNAAGTARVPNTASGVTIAGAAHDNTIGPGNVIAGNGLGVALLSGSTANVVAGNYIGTNASSAAGIGNTEIGVMLQATTANIIGGTTAAARNIISGNSHNGVHLEGAGATGNTVLGNYIGTNVAGTAALANLSGVALNGAVNNTIGGTTASARNIISGNPNGVFISASGTTNNRIHGNYIGLGSTGLAVPNTTGVTVSGGSGNFIGGDTAGTGNVISGNSSQGISLESGSTTTYVRGNFIGTNPTGTSAAPNAAGGINISGPNNVIGGSTAAARNVISGQYSSFYIPGGVGIYGAAATGNSIVGNYIGTDVTGMAAIPNHGSGVLINGAPNNFIGGTTKAEGNLISGNDGGIFITGAGATGNRIRGNVIGLNALGTSKLVNPAHGVTVNAPNNIIGGPSAGERNVISGHAGVGVFLLSASGNTVRGNYIGTNEAGTDAIPNGTGVIVHSAANSVIGGPAAADGNVISGITGRGVWIRTAGSAGTQLQSNRIGTDASGSVAVPNTMSGVVIDTTTGITIGPGNVVSGNGEDGIQIKGASTAITVKGNTIGRDSERFLAVPNQGRGIWLTGSSAQNTIGGTASADRNLIANNTGVGVFIDSGVENAVLGTSFSNNGGINIDLAPAGKTANDNLDGDSGVNNLQNTPVLTGATTTSVTGTLNSTPNTAFRIEIFGSESCSIQTFIDFVDVTTNGEGNASFTKSISPSLAPGAIVEATATNPANNTSEFSDAAIVPAPSGPSTQAGVSCAPPLTLIGMEVTQAISNLDPAGLLPSGEKRVHLFAGRPTFVVAHVFSRAGSAATRVLVKLIVRRGLTVLGELQGASAVKPGVLNESLTDSRFRMFWRLGSTGFVFRIPEAWTTVGALSFEFEGTSHVISCDLPYAEGCNVDVNLEPPPTLLVKLVKISVLDSLGQKVGPSQSDLNRILTELKTTLPISQVQVDGVVQLDVPTVMSLQNMSNVLQQSTQLMQEMQRSQIGNAVRRPEGSAAPGSSSLPIYLGVLPADACAPVCSTNARVLPQTRDRNAAGALQPRGIAVMWTPGADSDASLQSPAHALAQALNPCSGWGPLSTQCLPYAQGRFNETADVRQQYVGFDVFNEKKYVSAIDITQQSAELNHWVSDYTYRKLHAALTASSGGAPPLASVPNTTGSVTLIAGTVSLSAGTGTIDSVVTLNGPETALSAGGSYAVQFRDAQGQPLATYEFTPSDRGTPDSASASFVMTVPSMPSAARLVLLRAGQVIDTHAATANAPVISIVAPNGGTVSGATTTLQWSASDADGDALKYLVQYSSDNGTSWNTVATRLTSTSFEINLGNLSGSTEARIRVFASDGFHTTSAQSAVFAVPNSAPLPRIESPLAGSRFVGTQRVVFRGAAFDNEDGELGSSALTWSSNLSGVLGTGLTLDLAASGLAEGTHIITLTAVDSGTAPGTATAQITVYRTQPRLPAAIVTLPRHMWFSTVAGGVTTASQTLDIQNGGDGTLSWTAAVDEPWLAIEHASGTAPSTTSVTIDAAGLSAGEHIGHVILTSTGASNSPLSVEVTLTVVGCSYSTSASSQSFGGNAGTSSVGVTVQSGCAWKAISHPSWVTITAGATGTGNGTVSYSVAKNYVAAARTGYMTLGGQTFAITQDPTTDTAPAILAHPAHQAVMPGQSASLSVTASGTSPAYQWYIGTSGTTTNAISGATSASYTTPALTATTNYWVRVSNSLGTADSQTGTVAVVPYEPFTDHVIEAGITSVKAVHVTELRSRINTQRQRFGLIVFAWTDSTLTIDSTGIRAVHIAELRQALLEAYAAAGVTEPTFTDATLSPGSAPIKRVHIQELRDAVIGLEAR